MKKKKLIFGCFIIFFLFFSISSFANSAQTYWEGVDSSGVITTDQNCPLEVTREDLTFTISSLPNFSTDVLEYSSNVSAKYSFYNPATYDVTATLAFPFGSLPYYFDIYNFDSGTFEELDYTSKYNIIADGKILEKTIRHTFGSEFYFDIQNDLKKLKQDFIKDDFWKDDLEIHKYTYEVLGLPNQNTNFCLAYTIPQESFYVFGNSGFQTDDRKKSETYGFWINPNGTVDIYFVGEVDKFIESNIKFYENMGLKKEVTGQLKFCKEETKTFKDYAFMYYDEKYGVSEVDWYNAIQDMLDVEKIFDESSFDLRNRLLCWYEYELTVRSKESVINEVVAPLFPSFDASYEPAKFTFTYLLSPASTWKDFSDLNIKIITDFYILTSSLGSLEKLEDGSFQLHLDKLPNDEFVFEVSTSSNPKKTFSLFGLFFIILMGIVVLACLAPFAIILIIVLMSTRKKSITKEQKKLKICYGIEATLATLMFIFGLLSLFSYGISSVAVIGIFACFGMIICLSLEALKLHNPIAGRLCVSIFALIFFGFCFINNDSIYESFEMIGTVSLLFGVILFIMEIVKIVKFNRLIHNNENGIISIPTPKSKNGYYPIGYLNNKWRIGLYAFLGVWLISFIVLIFILTFREQSITLVCVFYFLGLLVFTFGYTISMALINEKDFRVFNKDLDYDKVENNILKKLENPKINPETRNYFLMKLSVLSMAFSLEKYHSLQKEIFVPENKAYRMVYETNTVNFLLSQENMKEEAEKLIHLYPKNKMLKKRTEEFVQKWKAYYDGDIIGSIDNLAPYQTKNENINSFHLYIQIYYYKHKNNLVKSEELKRLFLTKYGKLKVLVDELKDGIDFRMTYEKILKDDLEEFQEEEIKNGTSKEES